MLFLGWIAGTGAKKPKPSKLRHALRKHRFAATTLQVIVMEWAPAVSQFLLQSGVVTHYDPLL